MKGLLCSIYRNNKFGDCSLEGISSKCDFVILVGTNIPEIFSPSADAPAVQLVRRNIFGKEYIHAEPITKPNTGYTNWQAGGTYIYTSDSRFPSPYPISLHDRSESKELNRILST